MDGILRRVARLVAAVMAATLLGCGQSQAPAADPLPLPRSPSGSVYFLPAPGSWRQGEARNPATAPNPVEASLDWYAEYERFPDPTRSEHVRVSGHAASTTVLQQTELRGFRFARVDGERWPATHARSPDTAGPTVILFSVATDFTLMVLSYQLDLESLLEWSRSLEPVSEAAWVAAGGVVAK